jgi:hypothetical protein
MVSEKLSKTVDFREEIPEPTWTCLRRVFESFSETMDSPTMARLLSATAICLIISNITDGGIGRKVAGKIGRMDNN